MASTLLKRGNENFLAVEQKKSPNLIYKLKGFEKYSFNFYEKHLFPLNIKINNSLSSQPFGILGSTSDFSGRRTTPSKNSLISSTGLTKNLDQPIYSLVEKVNEKDLKIFLDDSLPEKRDLVYASISTSCFAMGGAGDDLYLNTLFFMNKGYGLLTEISAIAGRDIEDCCSPEFHYKTTKVKLNKNPLKRIKERDIIGGTQIAEWNVSTNPKIINTIEAKFNEPNKAKKLDSLIENLFLTIY